MALNYSYVITKPMAIYSIKNLHGHDGAFLIRRARLVVDAQVEGNGLIVINEVASSVIGPDELDLLVETRRYKEPKPRKILKPGILLSVIGTTLVGICALLYKGFIGEALGIKPKTASSLGAIGELILGFKEGDIVTITKTGGSNVTGIVGSISIESMMFPMIKLKGFHDSIGSYEIAQITTHKNTNDIELSVTDDEMEEKVRNEISSIPVGSKIKATCKSGEVKEGILDEHPSIHDLWLTVKSVNYNKFLDTYNLGFNIDVWRITDIEKVELLESSYNSKITSPAGNPSEEDIDKARKLIEEDRKRRKDTHDLAERA